MRIVVLGGLGHVGLVLSLKLASLHHKVIIVDPNMAAMEMFFNNNQAKFDEKGIGKMIQLNKKSILIFSNLKGFELEFESDGILPDCVIVATNNDDVMSIFKEANFGSHILILIRQTVKLGTLKMLRGHNYNVVYIPERLAQGKGFEEIDVLPQIIGVDNDKQFQRVAKLFNWVECIKVSYEEAELAKLFCNYYRYGQFALANDMYLRAVDAKADFYRLRDAMMKDYPRMRDFPKAGFAGGFCLGKDTKHLIGSSELAWDILPTAVDNVNKLEFVAYLIHIIYCEIAEGNHVGVLGVTAKANNDELRESVYTNIIEPVSHNSSREELLMWHDPYLKNGSYTLASILKNCKTIIIGVPHKEYAKLDFSNKRVIDPWGIVVKPNRVHSKRDPQLKIVFKGAKLS